VQLRQAEAFGMLDHHDACIGHVDADLDHGGGDQYVERALGNCSMARSLSAAFILPCTRPTTAGEILAEEARPLDRGGEVAGSRIPR